MKIPYRLKHILEYQQFPHDCGMACMKMICCYYKLDFKTELSGIPLGVAGLNMLQLQKIAAENQCSFQAFRITAAVLPQINAPFILVECNQERNHAALSFNKFRLGKKMWIADPAKGWVAANTDNCLARYDYIIQIRPLITGVKQHFFKNEFVKLLQQLIPHYQKTYLRLIFLSVIAGFLTAVTSFFTQKLIDTKAMDTLQQLSFAVLVSLVILLVIKSLVELCAQLLGNYYQEKLSDNMYSRLFNQMGNLSPKLQFSLGKAAYLALLNDLKGALNAQQLLLQFFLFDLLLLFFYLVICAFYSLKITLFLSLFAILPVFLVYFSSEGLLYKFKLSRESNIKADNHFLAYTKTIGYGSFSHTVPVFSKSLLQSYSHFFSERNKAFTAVYRFRFLLNTLMSIESGIVIYLLINDYRYHRLTTGEFSILFSVSFILNQMIYQALKLPLSLKEYLPHTKRFNTFMAKSREKTPAIILPPFEKLQLSNYSLKDPKTGKDLMTSLTLAIRKNEWLVITGQNGKGKSLLLQSLFGFYPASDGAILWNNEIIKQLPPSCAYLCQKPTLFKGSLLFNITLDENTAPENMESFLSFMGMPCFLAQFKFGWQTLFSGEKDELSVGEVKLIAFMREIYKQPQLLILDEPTASLSCESTHHLLNILEKLRGNTTLLIVSHEQLLINRADKIVELV
ncbi:MAG: ATP-binding cassette domain-containing protein [Pelobium sp.]